MFQTNETSGLYFFLSIRGKHSPQNSIRKNFLPGITKAPGAGS